MRKRQRQVKAGLKQGGDIDTGNPIDNLSGFIEKTEKAKFTKQMQYYNFLSTYFQVLQTMPIPMQMPTWVNIFLNFFQKHIQKVENC